MDRLVAAGLVAKRVASDDRRKVHVFLTKKGRATTAELVDQALAVEREVAVAYGSDNAQALRDELLGLIERFSAPARAGRRPGNLRDVGGAQTESEVAIFLAALACR